MIVLDIESSGLDTGRCGIWQIGAVEFENPKNVFLEESRIDDEDEIAEEALMVIGKTKEDLRDKKKQSQKQMIENFLKWCKTCDERIVAGHNVGFDIIFIQSKCIRYGIKDKFSEVIGVRTIDLHTLASLKYKEKKGQFKMKDGKTGKSDMNLLSVMEFCGLKDTRRVVEKGKVIKEGEAHNALTDAKLTAECFRRLLK
ncbi:MAG: 3'-5' exonuclease [Nanoarchaeota archaeon]